MRYIKELIIKYENASYIITAYVTIWLSLVAYRFFLVDYIHQNVFFIFIAWIPNYSAALVTGISKGYNAILEHFSGFFIWKLSFKWWLYGVFVLPLLSVVALLVLYLIGGVSFDQMVQVNVSSLIVSFMFHLALGPTGEEAGWRGFMLTRLQAKMSTLKANLIIGIVWSVWNLPIWVILPNWSLAQIPFWLFTLMMMSFSPIYAWIYNNTKGSLLVVGIAHALSITVNDILMHSGIINNGIIFLSIYIGCCAIVSGILYYIYGQNLLSRLPIKEIPLRVVEHGKELNAHQLELLYEYYNNCRKKGYKKILINEKLSASGIGKDTINLISGQIS